MRHKRKRTALAALASLSLIGLPTAAHAVAGAEQAGVAPIGAPAAAAPGVVPVGGPGAGLAAPTAVGADSAATTPVGADNAARDEEDARAQNGQDARSADGAQSPDDSQSPDGAQSADGAGDQAESAGAGATTPIPDIQKTGEGDDSALVGKTVTAVGVVTSAHPKGEDGLASTLDGFTIQTPGTGGSQGAERQSSDGLFAYVGKADVAMPTIGQCVRVTGKVSEYPATGPKTPAQTQSLTQLAVRSVETIDGCDPVKPVPLTAVPAPAQMEALESMLVEPQGTWTITDNYQANQYGTLSLTPGSEPLCQATDAVAPGDEARAMEADNAARTIALDDGTSTNLQRGAATGVPYAYLANGSPARVGYHVGFTGPVVLDSRHSAFVLQPTRMVAAHPDRSPVSISGERPGVPQVEGDVRVATFNVLNYFSDLGQDEPGCQGYPDREGAFVTAKKCKVRGAWSRAAFENQQTKIVQAINAIGADVVALEEIENPVAAGAGQDRDGALKALVDALNAHAGEQVWAHVPSPAAVPADEDVIRVAFIYRRATIEPVGESKILDDPAFTGLARQARERRVVEDLRLADGLDGGAAVYEGDADDVLVRGDRRRAGDVGPHLLARVRVERIDQGLQRAIAVLAGARGDRVLDLLQSDHVGAYRVDGLHDLRLLVLEGGPRPRAAHLALLRGDEGALAVGVALAPGLVLAQVGEVVEDVEGRHPHVPFDLGDTGALAGDAHGRAVRVGRDHPRRLEDERRVARVEDNGPGEAHVVADPGRGAVGQVRVGHPGGGPALEVGARPVVEGDRAGGVVRLHRPGLVARGDGVGGLAQRLAARSEGEGPVLVGLVVICDGPCALGLDEHRFERLHLRGCGHRGQGDRLHGVAPVDRLDRPHRQLREALRLGGRLGARRRVLRDLARHPHALADRRHGHIRFADVGEEAVGALPLRSLGPAGPGGLDGEAVERGGQAVLALRVGARDDADSRHRLPDQGGVVPLPRLLDVGDRSGGARPRGLGLVSGTVRALGAVRALGVVRALGAVRAPGVLPVLRPGVLLVPRRVVGPDRGCRRAIGPDCGWRSEAGAGAADWDDARGCRCGGADWGDARLFRARHCVRGCRQPYE